MNTYILLVVTSLYSPLPHTFTLTEFSSKQSCEVALNEAKRFWKTIDHESKCISVEAVIKKEKLKKELKKEEEQGD